MEPPSYEEARLHPSALGLAALNVAPPPSYDASLHPPPTPPPTYGEAVTIEPDAFPVLTVPTAVNSQNTGDIVHPITQVGVTRSAGIVQTQEAVVVTQPQPVPILHTNLGDSPGVTQCPNCHHTVTTKVTHSPGKAAWCMCLLFSVMGLVCGCCLIPFMMRSLQDVHHSCPRCEIQLHTYKR